MKRYLSRLTYANTVATLALFVAVSTGGAYAASQLAKNSVGKKQLRKAAVTSRAVKNQTLAVKDLSRTVRARLTVSERANIRADGSAAAGTSNGSSRTDPNVYTVGFGRDVSRCTYGATLASVGSVGEPPAGRVTVASGFEGSVIVRTFDAGGAPAPSGFHLLVTC